MAEGTADFVDDYQFKSKAENMAAARAYFTEADWAIHSPYAQEQFGNQVENYELQLKCGK